MRVFSAGTRHVFAVALAVGALACRAGSGGSGGGAFREAAPTRPSGAYEYVANLPGYRLEGVVAIMRDTVILEPRDGLCKPAAGPPNVAHIAYECVGAGKFDNVWFALDRHNAVQRSRWSATERVQRTRRVCVAFAQVSTGARVCVRSEIEQYEETVRHSGQMQLRPRGG